MPRIRPQSNNIKVKVSTQQTDDTVNVSTTNSTNPVKASNSMAEYWSNKSKEWAISENIVDGTDYSSKHYAQLSKESYDGIDELVEGFEDTVEEATTSAVQEISDAKDDAIADVIIEGGTQVNLVETTGGTLVTQMSGLKDQTLGYKNDAQTYASNANTSATNASTSANNAQTSATSASNYANEAKDWANKTTGKVDGNEYSAKYYAEQSASSASSASDSATLASNSANSASGYATNAYNSATSASSSATNASASANNASTSETNAQTYAGNASTSATNASNSATNSNIWAEGTDEQVQTLGGVHSAKGWAEESSKGQLQADWNQTDNTKKDFIKNKPTIPTATDVKINSTSITNQGVANIVTNSAYDASSNKIATMSDIPASEIFVATYGTTTFNEVLTAYNTGKTILCKYNSANSFLYLVALGTNSQQSIVNFYFTDFIYTVETTVVCNITTGWSIATYNYPTCSPNVGNSTTPVYINNRVVTSTGLSIASSRFDGQWVYSFSEIDTSTSVGDHVINLSSYLPNDSYKYEVLINVGVYNSDSSSAEIYMSSDVISVPYSDSYAKRIAHCNANSRAGCNRFTMPVGTSRTLTKTIKNKAPSACRVGLLGYKRIGTNS